MPRRPVMKLLPLVLASAGLLTTGLLTTGCGAGTAGSLGAVPAGGTPSGTTSPTPSPGGPSSSSPSTPATSPSSQASSPVRQIGLQVWFTRNGKLFGTERFFTVTPGVAGAAISGVLQGPSAAERAAGLRSQIPAGTTLR